MWDARHLVKFWAGARGHPYEPTGAVADGGRVGWWWRDGPGDTHASDHNGVTSHMSEARTDTTQTRPPGADAARADAGGSGKHRGGVSMESTDGQPHGRHRRPAEGGGRAA
ncbi:hypothetical protein GCM10018966_035950 [Streptomyces yanii]